VHQGKHHLVKVSPATGEREHENLISELDVTVVPVGCVTTARHLH